MKCPWKCWESVMYQIKAWRILISYVFCRHQTIHVLSCTGKQRNYIWHVYTYTGESCSCFVCVNLRFFSDLMHTLRSLQGTMKLILFCEISCSCFEVLDFNFCDKLPTSLSIQNACAWLKPLLNVDQHWPENVNVDITVFLYIAFVKDFAFLLIVWTSIGIFND